MYVGKGLPNRSDVHLKKGSHNLKFDRKLKKIQKSGLIPDIIKIHCETENQAFMLERFWIKTIGRHDLGLGPLCNYTDGGEGSSGYKPTAETKAKLSAAKKGVPHSEKLKLAISKSRMGWKPSDITINNMKIAAQLRVANPEFRAKISNTLIGKMKGVVKSDNTKQKMSDSAKNRSHEQYEKIQVSRLKTLAYQKSIRPKIERECEACKQLHFGEYGSGRFCGIKCTRAFSTMVKRNVQQQ